jgi:hypothetical protein
MIAKELKHITYSSVGVATALGLESSVSAIHNISTFYMWSMAVLCVVVTAIMLGVLFASNDDAAIKIQQDQEDRVQAVKWLQRVLSWVTITILAAHSHFALAGIFTVANLTSYVLLSHAQELMEKELQNKLEGK